ncbi:MAG: stalk domain-containing protein [Defluviitaleaceae bacterium]|nr:stalk domain-containing protein [Defluviitaleaceae bacterium]
MLKTAKKLLSCILGFVMALGLAAPTAVYANEIRVTIDGRPVDFAGQGAAIVDGHAFVPIRGVFEAIGFDVEWDYEESMAIMRRDGLTIRVTPYSETFNVCGTDYPLEVPARNIGGSAMMPARAVLERADYEVNWDGQARTLDIAAVDFVYLAEQGDVDAQTRLFQRYVREENYARAAYWAERAAEQGDAASQTALGIMYLGGQGVSQSNEQAEYWARRAADQNFAEGQTLIGFMYMSGLGVTLDYEQAIYWFEQAIEQGNASAQSNIGIMYFMGWGKTQDHEQAVYWYRRSAEQGYAMAQSNLGVMYYLGQGVPQDDEQAVYWYRRSADQNHNLGQNNLGVMYRDGRGVEQDNEQAAYWFRKAADQGNALALINLATLPAQYR